MLGLVLTSCSDQTMEASSEDFSSAADILSDERALAQTAEIDRLLKDDPRTTIFPLKNVFETETELLVREEASVTDYTIEDESQIERSAYFGDLHVHTAYSFDGYAFGTLATPYDAYRFAKGEAIKNPGGYNMQLSRPMDFYAVTDHAMFLGLVKAAADTSTAFSKNEFSEPYNDLNAPDNFGTGFISSLKRLLAFSGFLPDAVAAVLEGDLDRKEVLDVVRSAWDDTIDAADQFNDPGKFTTFAAYEYTTSTSDMGNLHRNVIFSGSDRLPREPFSRFHSDNPEDLWDWMDELREKGVESLAIILMPPMARCLNG
jgi:hypothetical protein